MPGCCMNDKQSTSAGVSGPSRTVRARRQRAGTCAALSVTLGCAATRSLRRLPHHVYECSKVSVAAEGMTCRSCPSKAE